MDVKALNVVEEMNKIEQNAEKEINKDAVVVDISKETSESQIERPEKSRTKSRKEKERKMKTEKHITSIPTTVAQAKKSFVEFSYASKDGFERFEAVKAAKDIIHDAIRHTGGDMPKELLNAYEGLADVMDRIKDIELDVIRQGR